MNLKKEYLSDAELEQLIAQIEQNDMVPAPPDLMENVVAEISGNFPEEDTAAACMPGSKPERSVESKVLELRRYRFRVWTSVAAAVAMVFLLSELPEWQEPVLWGRHETWKEVFSETQEKVLNKSREKFMSETRGETADEVGIMSRLLGGANLFDTGNRFEFFKEEWRIDE